MKRHVEISLLGFGEAAQAFLQGWRKACADAAFRAYDIKTAEGNTRIADAKREEYARLDVGGCAELWDAIEGASAVFSLVTADRAAEAAAEAAKLFPKGGYFFDCNSCAPGTKRQSAELIEAAGGRYVDTAVMAPVHPKLHETPLLLAGPHAVEAAAFLNDTLGMKARVVEGGVGSASAIKMVRSIAMKGMEAVMLECVLAGRRAGVSETVLKSLDQTYPGFGFEKRAAYMMERAATHGVRRAAEMREVANTVRELGFDGWMADATALWEDRIGALKADLSGIDQEDPQAVADVLLDAIGVQQENEEDGQAA